MKISKTAELSIVGINDNGELIKIFKNNFVYNLKYKERDSNGNTVRENIITVGRIDKINFDGYPNKLKNEIRVISIVVDTSVEFVSDVTVIKIEDIIDIEKVTTFHEKYKEEKEETEDINDQI